MLPPRLALVTGMLLQRAQAEAQAVMLAGHYFVEATSECEAARDSKCPLDDTRPEELAA